LPEQITIRTFIPEKKVLKIQYFSKIKILSKYEKPYSFIRISLLIGEYFVRAGSQVAGYFGGF